MIVLFFFNDTATTEIYTLSLHDALPISQQRWQAEVVARFVEERLDPERLGLMPIFRQAEVGQNYHLGSMTGARQRAQHAEARAGAQVQVEYQHVGPRSRYASERAGFRIDGLDQVHVRQASDQLCQPRSEQ